MNNHSLKLTFANFLEENYSLRLYHEQKLTESSQAAANVSSPLYKMMILSASFTVKETIVGRM